MIFQVTALDPCCVTILTLTYHAPRAWRALVTRLLLSDSQPLTRELFDRHQKKTLTFLLIVGSNGS